MECKCKTDRRERRISARCRFSRWRRISSARRSISSYKNGIGPQGFTGLSQIWRRKSPERKSLVCQDAPKRGEVVVAHVMRLQVYFNEYGAGVRKNTTRAGQNCSLKTLHIDLQPVHRPRFGHETV